MARRQSTQEWPRGAPSVGGALWGRRPPPRLLPAMGLAFALAAAGPATALAHALSAAFPLTGGRGSSSRSRRSRRLRPQRVGEKFSSLNAGLPGSVLFQAGWRICRPCRGNPPLACTPSCSRTRPESARAALDGAGLVRSAHGAGAVLWARGPSVKPGSSSPPSLVPPVT